MVKYGNSGVIDDMCAQRLWTCRPPPLSKHARLSAPFRLLRNAASCANLTPARLAAILSNETLSAKSCLTGGNPKRAENSPAMRAAAACGRNIRPCALYRGCTTAVLCYRCTAAPYSAPARLLLQAATAGTQGLGSCLL